MTLKTRLAIGASLLSIAGVAGIAPAAQAAPAPSVCSSRAFTVLDRSINANPRAFAELLALEYRFAPRAALASFNQLGECDSTTALNLWDAFDALAPNEAGAFQTAFWNEYPGTAASVFGDGISIG